MLLTLDTGPTHTGWCAGTGSRALELGAWDFEDYGADYGRLGAELHGNMQRAWARWEPDRVAFEAPILRVKRPGQKNGRTDTLPYLRRRYGMDFAVETFFTERGVVCREADLRDVKKALTGNPFATKDDMVAVARALQVPLPKGPGAKDAADALGIWLHELRDYDYDHWLEWNDRVCHARAVLD